MAASSTIAGARPATHSTPPAADSFSFPGGYYSPNEDVEVNGQELAWLELRQHGDPRTLAHRYPAQLWIAPAGTEDFGQYRCADPLIRRDTLDVYCETSPIGTVRIRGSFNEVLRPGWEKTVDWDLISHHVLANATITVQQSGRVVLSRRVGLVYWEGE